MTRQDLSKWAAERERIGVGVAYYRIECMIKHDLDRARPRGRRRRRGKNSFDVGERGRSGGELSRERSLTHH